MKYLDDMLGKYGFSDGEAVPDGAEVYRDIYIKAINAMAQRMGCEQRAEAFDRPGMHNWCLIAFTGDRGLPTPEMQNVIAVVRIGDWDSWVVSTCEPSDDFDLCLEGNISAILDENPVCDTSRPTEA